MKEALKTISLFSGSGGLDLGLLKTGRFEVCLANDIDPDACETYRRNIGDHIVCGDIRDLTKVPSADVIVGGPPCQGFSLGNPKRAFDDPRNWLFKEYARLLEEAKPKLFLMENVSGLLTLENGKVFELIKEGFASCGYHIYDKLMNAVHYGVPQSRNRVIIVGVRREVKDPFTFPEPTVHPPLFGEYKTVRDAILTASIPADDPNHLIGKLTPLNAERLSHIPAGGSMQDCPKQLWNGSDVKRAMRRLHPDKPSYTIVHNNCDHYYHPTESRRITIREMALLQTYPRSFVFCGSKSEQSRQVGNSVPVEFARHLGLSLAGFSDRYFSAK